MEKGDGAVSAVFSPTPDFRVRLDRDLCRAGPAVALIGVNPSIAGAEANDQTIRKDMGFGARLGWGRIIKINKFSHVATDVRELAKCADPVGPDNNRYIADVLAECDLAVACWGPLAKLPKRLRYRWTEVLAMARRAGKDLHCFGTAKDGQPLHTCMIPYASPLTVWRAA